MIIYSGLIDQGGLNLRMELNFHEHRGKYCLNIAIRFNLFVILTAR